MMANSDGVELCRMVSNDRTCGHTLCLFGNYNTIFLARAFTLRSGAPLLARTWVEVRERFERYRVGTRPCASSAVDVVWVCRVQTTYPNFGLNPHTYKPLTFVCCRCCSVAELGFTTCTKNTYTQQQSVNGQQRRRYGVCCRLQHWSWLCLPVV